MAVGHFYEVNHVESLRQRAIYWCPVHWLREPLTLLRSRPSDRMGCLQAIDARSVGDAFSGPDTEEDVVARAKKRPVVIVKVLGRSVYVAPIYSLKDGEKADILANRGGPFVYLPARPESGIAEGKISTSQVVVLPKRVLRDVDHLGVSLSVQSFKGFLRQQIAHIEVLIDDA